MRPELPWPAFSTLREAERYLKRHFQDAGLETPALDARLLIEAATGIDRLAWISAPDMPLGTAAAATIARCGERRLAREPVSRIVGVQSFYGRDFKISPATLDPRADSETLIDLALRIADEEDWRTRPIRILDIGTGSGCLLVTLLSELPIATGVGTDISAAALTVADRNGCRHGVEQRVEWRETGFWSGVSGPFDLIVANLPYIPTAEISGLEPEVGRYDPVSALDGGADGLDIYRHMIQTLDTAVFNGWLICEVGPGQAGRLAELLRSSHLVDAATLRGVDDLGGHQRCVACRAHLRAALEK